ncbi:MAG: PAS domain-containing sensor histidine kinase, partial [Cyanobacteria bacterium]|nr:PAS domain-containing sensor histidine kinase [Cyanobacteriota bacterium]
SLYYIFALTEVASRKETTARTAIDTNFAMLLSTFESVYALATFGVLPTEAISRAITDSQSKAFIEHRKLRELVRGNSEQTELVDHQKAMMLKVFQTLGSFKESLSGETNSEGLLLLVPLRVKLEHQIEELGATGNVLTKVLDSGTKEFRADALKWREYCRLLMVSGFLASFVASSLLVYLFTRGITSRLSVLSENARRIARKQELLPLSGGRDEIGQLEENFLTMARTLASCESRMTAIVKNVSDVILTVTRYGVIEEASPAAERLWGFSRDEIVGTHITTIVVPEDVDSTNRQIERIVTLEHSHSFENRVRRKDGSPMEILWSCNWSETEKVLYFVAHDLTARKELERTRMESEEELRSIVEGLPLALMEVGSQGLIERTNEQCEVTTGYSRKELLGRHISFIFFGEEQSFIEVERQEKTLRPVETRILTKSGRIVPVAVTLSTVDTDGKKRRTMVALQDISSKYEIERVKQEFIAMISHDLKSPLSSIIGMYGLFLEGILGDVSDRQRETLGEAESLVEGLIQLISDLLDVQKLESGTFMFEFEPDRLKEIVSKAVEEVAAKAGESGITFQITDNEVIASVDSLALTGAFAKLLEGMLMLSTAGSVITIYAREHDGFVEIDFIDRLNRIAESKLGRMFEKYGQIELADDNQGGSNLNLVICRLIVERHGGEIRVSSSDDGTTFSVRLPAGEVTN